MGASVASGVPDQPVGFEEIVAGAREPRPRRVRARRPASSPSATRTGWSRSRSTAVAGGTSAARRWPTAARDGLGFSSGFAYPPACADAPSRARADRRPLRRALGVAHPAEAGPASSARGLGNIGKLTGGALPRADYARHAVLCALVSFLHPDLYARRGEPP